MRLLRLPILGSAWTAVLLTGCSGVQHALDPAGDGAHSIDRLWTVFLGICAVVFALVIATLLWSLLHRRGARPIDTAPEVHPAAGPEQRLTRIVSVAVGATILILFGLTLASYSADRSVLGTDPDALEIQITGKRWWWEIRYPAADGQPEFRTANELHLPVGRPVVLSLSAEDVIHSFWAPNLQGKKDLIPGMLNRLGIRIDQPGTWRGQCAEFCGLQHANMALWIVGDSPEDFSRWRAQQGAPAAAPVGAEEQGGQALLVTKCGACHAVRGSPAGGVLAPDLTHLASRLAIAAGTLPNTRGNRAGWILDPQTPKPGNLMPPIELDPGELQMLLAYLDRLQ